MDDMKTFAQFMTESTELTASEFPIISANVNTSTYLGKILPRLNKALKAGSIPNPDFVDLKFYLGSIHDALMRAEISDPFLNAGKYLKLPDDVRKVYDDLNLTYGAPVHVAGKVKKLEKSKVQHPLTDRYKEVAREFMLLVDAIVSLKDKAVKRAPKNPDADAAYVPPMAAKEAWDKVTAVLTKLTDDIKDEYAAQELDYYVRMIEKWNGYTNVERRNSRDPNVTHLAQKVAVPSKTYMPGEFTLKADWKEILGKEADYAASFMQARFLAKNTKKLAKIIELKHNIEGNPKILHARAGSGVFEGEIEFVFADNSRFQVRNKIVVKRSMHGRDFLQFPTTFHAARLPNGKMMEGQPSEKEMIEDFAGGSAADVPAEEKDDTAS